MSRTRPQGLGQFVGGGFAALFGAVAIVKGLTMAVSRYPTVDVDALATRWNFLAVGAFCLTLALILFAVGWIIEAMSFLPGKGDAALSTDQPVLELSSGHMHVAEAQEETPSPLAWLIVGGGIITVGLIGFLVIAT